MSRQLQEQLIEFTLVARIIHEGGGCGASP
jgi:hypothetical protein